MDDDDRQPAEPVTKRATATGDQSGHAYDVILDLDGDGTLKSDGLVVLADLVVLRQVRVEVVFPGKA